jgi:hypothetical protein
LDGEIDKIPKTRTPPGTASAFSRMDRKGLRDKNYRTVVAFSNLF